MASTQKTAPSITAPDDLAQQIGREIDRARTVAGLTISSLHRLTGISRTVLQGYEAGRFKPGARELYLLAKALKISANKLLFGRDDLTQPDPLADLIGPVDKAESTSKIAVVYTLLSREEQRAFLLLLSLLAETRVGGRDKLREILRASETVIAEMPGMIELVTESLSDETKQEIARRMAGMSPPSTAGEVGEPARKRRAPKQV